MRRWSELAERVAATTRTSEKTALLAEYFEKPGASVAAVVYAGTFFLSGVSYNLLWRAAIAGRRLLRPDCSEEEIQEISRKYWLGIPGYLAAAAAAFVNPSLTVAICIALLVVWVAVSRQV